jgi:hypothetical protein
LVFDQTTNTPVCSTTKRLVDVDTKTDGDFAVNTAMNDATKRFINVDTKTDRDNRDISVNTATKRPLLEKPDGDISFNTVKKRHIVEDDMKITKTFRLKHSSSAWGNFYKFCRKILDKVREFGSIQEHVFGIVDRCHGLACTTHYSNVVVYIPDPVVQSIRRGASRIVFGGHHPVLVAIV